MGEHNACDRMDDDRGFRCNLPATWRWVYKMAYPAGELRTRYRCDGHPIEESGWHSHPIQPSEPGRPL